MVKVTKLLYANHDVYKQEGSPEEVTSIQTFYESQYLEQNKPITYIRFKIKAIEFNHYFFIGLIVPLLVLFHQDF